MMEFMDSLRRGVDRAGFEVDKLLRANRVRSRIGTLRSEIDGGLHEIGQKDLAGLEAELEAINDEAPHELEQDPLAQPAPSIATCQNCGHTVTEGANFCPDCGAGLAAPAAAPPSPPEPPDEHTEPPPPAG